MPEAIKVNMAKTTAVKKKLFRNSCLDIKPKISPIIKQITTCNNINAKKVAA